MLDFLRTGRQPETARDLLVQIAKQYPDREHCRRIWIAALYDQRRFLSDVIEYAFESWRSQTDQK